MPSSTTAVRSTVAGRRLEGHVPLERDTVDDLRLEPRRAGDDAVGAVGADQHVGVDRPSRRLARDPLGRGSIASTPSALAHFGPRSGGSLEQVRVEASPLGHRDQRRCTAPPESTSRAEPELEGVHDVLDHRPHTAGRLAQRASRQPAPARLVAREPRAVGDHHARARPREPQCRRRSRGPGAGDENVDVLHAWILGLARSP